MEKAAEIWERYNQKQKKSFKERLDEHKRNLFHLSRSLIITAIILGLLFLLLVPIITYFYFAADLTSKDAIMNRNNSGLILLDRNNQPFFTFYQPKITKFVPISEIPTNTQDAVIAIEDKDFYHHPGFSITAIIRSMLSDVASQQLAYGGSTITQQLVKNVLLTSQKSFLRKYQEVVLAAEIERRYSKQEILEMYLNSVYFGEGAFGIEEASQSYFGKSSNQLDLAQSTLLAGLLKAPSALSPISNDPKPAEDRAKVILQQMQQQGYITKDQMDAADAEVTTLQYTPKPQDINVTAPHFALMVKQQLEDKYGEETVARSGMKVQTTLDLSWQKYAETTVANQVNHLSGDNAHDGAAVVMDPRSGEVRVLVGSADWNNPDFGTINMATTARQPGSSFKPIVYGDALQQKIITPATMLSDEKTTFPGGYTPHDYDYKYRGQVTVRRALSNSLNIPAVEVLQKLGVSEAINQAQNMGISTLSDASQYGLSLVLGSAEVPLEEMTAAYGTFSDQGTYHTPILISKITDKNGHVIYQSDPQAKQVISPEAAFLISSILSDNKARAEEFGNTLTINRPAAVKTGTTSDFKDALTIGYTPSLVVGVWVGNANDVSMDSVAGSLGAAPIWRLLMEHFLAGTPIETFRPPSDISNELVCADKGLKVEEATSSAYQEYFISGTEPTQLCYTPAPTPTETPTPEPTETPSEEPTPTLTPLPTDSATPQFSPTISPSQLLSPLPSLPLKK